MTDPKRYSSSSTRPQAPILRSNARPGSRGTVPAASRALHQRLFRAPRRLALRQLSRPNRAPPCSSDIGAGSSSSPSRCARPASPSRSMRAGTTRCTTASSARPSTARPTSSSRTRTIIPRLQRSIFSNTDWSLIRACAATLWLVKPRPPGQRPCFVAAVDPLHERDKPADLDKRILGDGTELSAALGGEAARLPCIRRLDAHRRLHGLDDDADRAAGQRHRGRHARRARRCRRGAVQRARRGARAHSRSPRQHARALMTLTEQLASRRRGHGRHLAQRLERTVPRQHRRGRARPAALRPRHRETRGLRAGPSGLKMLEPRPNPSSIGGRR